MLGKNERRQVLKLYSIGIIEKWENIKYNKIKKYKYFSFSSFVW